MQNFAVILQKSHVFFSISDDDMQVVTQPMETIPEGDEEAPPVYSNLNIASSATTPAASPKRTRRPHNHHLTSNLIASLRSVGSALHLSNNNLGENNKETIDIGYVQGIRTSRRDIHRQNSHGEAGHHALGANHTARHLLQTLSGAHTTCNTPAGSRFDVSRLASDSIMSRLSVLNVPNHGGIHIGANSNGTNVTSPRPRSHCFQVEPVDESALNSTPIVQNTGIRHGSVRRDSGMTNDSFVIDMSHHDNRPTSLATNSQLNTATCQSSNVISPLATNSFPEESTEQDSKKLPLKSPTGHVTFEDHADAATYSDGGKEKLDEVPEIRVSEENSPNSSTESLEYIKPDQEQCTVNSLTPLLPDSSDSEGEAPATVV